VLRRLPPVRTVAPSTGLPCSGACVWCGFPARRPGSCQAGLTNAMLQPGRLPSLIRVPRTGWTIELTNPTPGRPTVTSPVRRGDGALAGIAERVMCCARGHPFGPGTECRGLLAADPWARWRSTPILLLIADDDEVTRTGLRSRLWCPPSPAPRGSPRPRPAPRYSAGFVARAPTRTLVLIGRADARWTASGPHCSGATNCPSHQFTVITTFQTDDTCTTRSAPSATGSCSNAQACPDRPRRSASSDAGDSLSVSRTSPRSGHVPPKKKKKKKKKRRYARQHSRGRRRPPLTRRRRISADPHAVQTEIALPVTAWRREDHVQRVHKLTPPTTQG